VPPVPWASATRGAAASISIPRASVEARMDVVAAMVVQGQCRAADRALTGGPRRALIR
jgi:hypothetical protein